MRIAGTSDIYKHIVVVFNATNGPVTFSNSQLQGLALQLHPVQRKSSDPTNGSPRSTPQQGLLRYLRSQPRYLWRNGSGMNGCLEQTVEHWIVLLF